MKPLCYHSDMNQIQIPEPKLSRFLFAGTTSINPLLLLIELFLVLAWRNAGWLGLDRWLLPWLGVPWQPGKAFKN